MPFVWFLTNKDKCSLATVVTLLLHHLDALDSHLATLRPGWVPLVSGLPELRRSSCARIHPWLPLDAVCEPTIGTANRDIEDKIEILVKWSAIPTSRAPRVNKFCAVTIADREVAFGPEWLAEADIHDLKKTSVNVGEDVFFGPLNTESVETGSVCGVKSLALDVVTPVAIIGGVRPPMQGAANNVVTTLRVGVVVAARLCNVDFTRFGPRSIGVVHWQHPDGWPQPISARELCFHFNAAILDRFSTPGTETCRLNRVDNGSIGSVCDCDTVGPNGRGATAIGQEVDDSVFLDQACVLQSGLKNELAVLDESIFFGISGLFELAVTFIKGQIQLSFEGLIRCWTYP